MSRLAPALRLLTRQPLALRTFNRSSALLATTTRRNMHVSPVLSSPPLDPVTRPHLLAEFTMKDKVVVISGGGRGLGLVQAEALLEAGAVGKPHGIPSCSAFR